MTDPLEVLHTPVVPVDPDPDFAARLRDRLRRALLQPTGDTMTITQETVRKAPPRRDALTPRLYVDDGQQALRWYAEAFGARLLAEPALTDGGRVDHAELTIGDSVLMLADERPELNLLSPKTRGGPSQSLHLPVPDVDTVFARAVGLGAEPIRQVADQPHGRNGVVSDPFGHRWVITASAEARRPRLRHGDIGHTSIVVPDVDRAASFYGRVLGWRAAPGSTSSERDVEGLPEQHIGLRGGQDHPAALLSFAVDDVHETIRRVRDAGGSAEEPALKPDGLSARCTDDQGMPFSVYQPLERTSPIEERLTEIVKTETGHGEISYLTIGFPDIARAQSFYSVVLGWDFVPGHTPGGWDVRLGDTGVRPMTGMYGGADHPVIVPSYAVDDIDTAVTKVREAGGTATAVTRRPYGLTAECADDQGGRFYLDQH